MTDRDWYRNASSGQRAYRETRDGVDVVVFDRPGQEITRKFNDREWLPDRDHRPLNRMAIAATAFAADVALCKQMGLHPKVDNWLSLTHSARIRWMEEGPQKSEVRKKLYEYIMYATEYLCDSGADYPPSVQHVRDALRMMDDLDA